MWVPSTSRKSGLSKKTNMTCLQHMPKTTSQSATRRWYP
jgi:hypothetical protein